MTDETTCSCSQALRGLSLHESTCAQFVNLIPNEIVTVYVPAPANTVRRIAVSIEDKELQQTLNVALNAAVQAQQQALLLLAQKYGIAAVAAGTDQQWCYDVPSGVWTRTR